jgi:uncharacterized protein YdaU (DUF1376 family)
VTTKKADTWMPWYVADYLADTAHLTTEQHGAYCLMLMAAWKRGGSLPKDDVQLAAVCRLPAPRWKAHKTILLEFFGEEPTQYSHKRVTHERAKAQEISDKKALNGAKGGSAKARNASKPDGEAGSKPLANGVAKAKQTPTPSPQPLPHPSDDAEGADAPSSAGKLPPCPHDAIVGLYHQVLPELPSVRLMPLRRKRLLERIWKFVLTSRKRTDNTRRAHTADQALTWIRGYFERVRSSDFLMGRTPRGNGHENWQCDLDFLLSDRGMQHVIEKTVIEEQG